MPSLLWYFLRKRPAHIPYKVLSDGAQTPEGLPALAEGHAVVFIAGLVLARVEDRKSVV